MLNYCVLRNSRAEIRDLCRTFVGTEVTLLLYWVVLSVKILLQGLLTSLSVVIYKLTSILSGPKIS